MPLPRRMLAPTPQALAAIRDGAARLTPSDEMADWFGHYVENSSERWAVDLDMIERLAPDRRTRILDVGSSPPVLVAALEADDRDVTGVDIEPDRFQVDGLRIARCDIERELLPFGDDAFDVVVLNEVMEHLRIDLIHTASELARVLRPGGYLLVSTPNARSSRGLVNFVVRGRSGWCGAEHIYREYDKLRTIGHMGHVREYTLKELRDFFAHFDLHLETVVWRDRDPRLHHRLAAAVAPSLSRVMSLVLRRE